MKLTTALLVILSSWTYFSGARTEDDAESHSVGSKIEKSFSTESTTLTSSKGTRLCFSEESSDITQSSATETKLTTSSMKLSQQLRHRLSSTLRPLPLGEDNFDEIRSEKKLFIDKTPFISELIKKGSPKLIVFTRPKRFGKSVFLQMVRRFLEGRKEFFDDTKIAGRGNGLTEDGTWTPYPVIYIDFEEIGAFGTATDFRRNILVVLEIIAKSYELKIRPNLDVANLINDLKTKTGKPVSILVDNYDVPLMKSLSTIKRKQIFAILSEFYAQIRAHVGNVRLALAIGISKLNILSNGHARFTDLTFDKRFSSIMGFDSKEVGQYLRPYFQRLDDGSKNRESETIPGFEEARKWYGGHQFAVGNEIIKTLNPASTCECLRKKEFGDYMGNTVLVSIIKDKMMKSNLSMGVFEDFRMEVSELQKFNLREEEISLPLFMLCNGFLTIKRYNEKSKVVCLGYPNDEIRRNLVQVLPPELVGEFALKAYLMEKDVDNFVRLLNEFTFKYLSHSLNLPLSEYMATRQILPILNATGFNFEEGKILWADDGKDEGDLDIHIKLPKSEFIVGMKYKHTAADSILQFMTYIIEREDAFRCRIRVDKEIFLLGMNVKPLEYNKKQIVTSAQIDEWVLLPYKDGKIWMNECKTSSNIADKFVDHLKNRLNNNWKEYLTSPKIIW